MDNFLVFIVCFLFLLFYLIISTGIAKKFCENVPDADESDEIQDVSETVSEEDDIESEDTEVNETVTEGITESQITIDDATFSSSDPYESLDTETKKQVDSFADSVGNTLKDISTISENIQKSVFVPNYIKKSLEDIKELLHYDLLLLNMIEPDLSFIKQENNNNDIKTENVSILNFSSKKSDESEFDDVSIIAIRSKRQNIIFDI